MRGTVVHALGMALVAWTVQTWLALVAMAIVGAAWMTTTNTLSLSLQLGLPDWVRARAMSTYQMAIMGAAAAGAALWGQVATHADLSTSLFLASITGVARMALAIRWMPDSKVDDPTPQRILSTSQTDRVPAKGQVMVSIRYLVVPEQPGEFRRLMFDERRRSRLQNGALSWELLHELNDPQHFTEIFVDETWTDYLRRFDRLTAGELALRNRPLAFHVGEAPPKVTRYLMESTV